MSDVRDYTSRKLVMARASLNAGESSEGLQAEAFRQGFLFHCYGVISGLLGEVLSGHNLVQRPVQLSEANNLLATNQMSCGLVEQIQSLGDVSSGAEAWLGVLLKDYEECFSISSTDGDENTAGFEQAINLIAVDSGVTQATSRGREESFLHRLQELVQEIRGQLQEW